MSIQQQIDDLKFYVEAWGTALTHTFQLRDTLLKIQSKGFALTNDAGHDMLQQRIRAVDEAILQHQKILSRMQNLLGRALTGEDVWGSKPSL
jgi:hypothetical protein